MAFKRNVEAYLLDWKSRETRKPLIIRGARQVGKTTLVNSFSGFYSHFITLNLEKGADRKYFEDFDDVKMISESLFLTYGIPLAEVGNTLLFIDEIQECPKAIQMLRFFYEEMPMLHIICAGSLLEFAIQKVKSFPVGRVEFLYLHPMNFEEYLEAIGKRELIEQLRIVPIRPVAHQILMDTFHRYAIIGGMPEVIKTDIDKSNLADLTRIYESIWGTYKNDVEKYTTNDTERKVIKHIMDTAPLYLDERVKFQGFGNSSYKSREVGESFRTLEDAKIIRLIYPTTDLQPPPKADLKKSPRFQILDTGLVNYALAIQAQMLSMGDLSNTYKGAVIPHLITQEIISLQQVSTNNPHFWVREKSQSNAEVDLVQVNGEYLIPIEIKSGSTGTLRSLHQFIDAVDHSYAVRMYGGVFSLEKAVTANRKPYLLMNLPYYLGTQLPAYLNWLVQQPVV
ncbi:ATP-binding protein [Chitinophaga sp. S165]|uniref:ATP-binding protein n=1 Tax=Chitinophaga sp. S165 TaxID=2135462 RepID=UPI000D70D900|nr:AAA family ATPase [Chitinophaga sp. S165]PWV44740.1 hypothetical protein C7475_11818 [Chitinophaga sp. S165]